MKGHIIELPTLLFTVFCFLTIDCCAQKSIEQIASYIKTCKIDQRGPYKDIRWFCKDGTTVSPQERCPDKGGVQRARYKDATIDLGKTNHVFLGQILSTTNNVEFWDKDFSHSRMKQYQLEQYLKSIDNGWVNAKAQYYRGAYQAEDEEEWGKQFIHWILSDTSKVSKSFLLIRQAAKSIPHSGDNNNAQLVRSISKEISNQNSAFMDIRVKIHGQPEQNDIQQVKKFKEDKKESLTSEVHKKLESLIAEMQLMFEPVSMQDFKVYSKMLTEKSNTANGLEGFIKAYSIIDNPKNHSFEIVKLASIIRKEIGVVSKSSECLVLLDMSIKLESMLVREATLWQPKVLSDQINKLNCLMEASAAFGYIEKWEWIELKKGIFIPNGENVNLKKLAELLDRYNRGLEWGIGNIRGNYEDVIKLYSAFEPLAESFLDDQVRSSSLLVLGNSVSTLGKFFATNAGFSNNVLNLDNQTSIRGLNSGFAFGELVVTSKSPDEIEIYGDKIYVFNRPPSDLKPIAGIATVTEGNMVSHVQLLARNLGIPNAVISAENLTALLPFNGQKVFYAVSNKGSVIMKKASDMSDDEKALFTKKVRSEDKIRVPIEQIDLSNSEILNLRNVNAKHSGVTCGPKAANLGQLKALFPDNVVEGLVIPFSIFKQHFDLPMPGENQSYWEFLNTTFKEANLKLKSGISESIVDIFVLGKLSILEKAIKGLNLSTAFQAELKHKFKEVFGKEMGSVPVFLRSDTNMEDLKDFTGAGLNLTLFNVLSTDAIFQGIKDVWASPYTERSYKWRQRYLSNPENVFPSILIIPSVNADYSGVMITKGVSSGKKDEITIAFNKGVGGAVEGQASESWLISGKTYSLHTPQREPVYMSIPSTGGVLKIHTTFEDRLLNTAKLDALSNMASDMKVKLTELGIPSPYDIELGFKQDKIWLFQVRPFVENKKSSGSEYLNKITPVLNNEKRLSLNSLL